MASNGGAETSVPIENVRPRPNSRVMRQNFNVSQNFQISKSEDHLQIVVKILFNLTLTDCG